MSNLILDKTVTIDFFIDSITIRKGIFNFTKLEITKEEIEDDILYNKLKKYFIDLKQGKSLNLENIEEKNIKEFFERLSSYSLLVQENNNIKFDFILTDIIDTKFFEQFDELKKISVLSIHDSNIFSIMPGKNLLIILSNFYKSKLLKINEMLIKTESKAFIIFNDGDYVHALYLDNNFTGCFNCFLERIIARIERLDDLDISSIDKIETNLENNNANYLFALSLVNMILNKSKMYNSIMLESKLLSFYLPTLEMHVDKLLKIPYCEFCGYISQQQAKENNTNLKRALEEIMLYERI